MRTASLPRHAALAAAGLVLTALALPAAAAPTPELTGATTVSGTGAGQALVHLSQDVRLEDAGVSIDGGGRLAGLVLQHVDAEPYLPDLLAVRLPGQERTEIVFRGGEDGPVLRRGTHRLTFFGEGATSATLHLPALAGATTLPVDAVAAAVRQLDARLDAGRHHSASAGDRLEGTGMLLSAAVVERDPAMATAVTACWAEGEGTGTALDAGPNCGDPLASTASGVVIDGPLAPGSGRAGTAALAIGVPAGEHRQGLSVTADGPVRVVEAMGAWLPLG